MLTSDTWQQCSLWFHHGSVNTENTGCTSVTTTTDKPVCANEDRNRQCSNFAAWTTRVINDTSRYSFELCRCLLLRHITLNKTRWTQHLRKGEENPPISAASVLKRWLKWECSQVANRQLVMIRLEDLRLRHSSTVTQRYRGVAIVDDGIQRLRRYHPSSTC